MPLSDNPQKGKTEKSYIRNGIISDTYSHFDKPKKNFAFSSNDYPKLKVKLETIKKGKKKASS